MKIAFTTSGKNLDAPMDSRFGRAAGYIIFDTDTETYEAIDNEQILNSPQGAGIQAAELIVRLGANSLVTGHCGPKAFRALSAAGVSVYSTSAETVSDALEAFRAGALPAMKSADVEGHW